MNSEFGPYKSSYSLTQIVKEYNKQITNEVGSLYHSFILDYRELMKITHVPAANIFYNALRMNYYNRVDNLQWGKNLTTHFKTLVTCYCRDFLRGLKRDKR